MSIWTVQHRKGDRFKKPYVVRWVLNGRYLSRSYRTKGEADRIRSALLVAAQSGEAFDDQTGEPVSWRPLPDQVRMHEWARRWLAEQWAEWAPRTRVSEVEALTRLLPLLVPPTAPPPPSTLRSHLVASLPPGGDLLHEDAENWLTEWGLQLGQLSKPLLAEVDNRLGIGDDGEQLAPSTAGRYRKVSRACVRRAVELGIIDPDPWPMAPRGRSRRKANRVKRAVPIRSLPSPEAMARILAAIPTHQPGSHTYQVMTAVAYYGGLRPSEVVMLRTNALHLPDSGWGRIEVTEADVSFDEPGEPKTGPRTVPIPPQLVEILRTWIKKNELGGNALLFRTRKGLRPRASNWSRALHRAQETCGYPKLRVYDCRHAAATTWLRAGVPLGDVAKRMGHSVETLVSTYVGALEGDEALANERIEAALSKS